MLKQSILTMMFLALSSTACGKFGVDGGSDGEAALLLRSSVGTCDRKNVTTVNLCTEAVGPDYTDPGYLDILKSSCESSGGAFSTNNCDATESFGVCVVGIGQSNATYVTYYAPKYDAASAKTECDATPGGLYIDP